MEDSVPKMTFLSIGKHMCEPERKEEPTEVDKPIRATIAESMDRSVTPAPEPTIRYEIHVCSCSLSIQR